MDNWWLFLVPLLFVLMPGIWRRRESIRFRLRVVIIAEVVYLLTVLLLVQIGWSTPPALLCGLLAALVAALLQRGRKRYISRSDRRRAIARFEYKTGQKYDPQLHELDHVVPFSKGGGNTADNLQVIDRHANRVKGGKAPWWDLLGR